MSASFDIQSSTGTYSVEVRTGAAQEWLPGFGQATIVADEFFRDALSRASLPAILVEATEANKSLDASPALIEQMRRTGANRSTHLVAMGGGIIQDLSAFIASVYMRGLRWTFLPTTVLAMVDSCIGGKSSINVGPYKNLVGTFHSPERVLIDPSLIATLPADQRASGLIEAAKICFCRGAESFAEHLACEPSVDMPADRLEQLIINSLRSKQWFIERDEFDQNERLLLNFGHTFGHAIEGASHFAINHGIAVGLGIECALEFERLRGVRYEAVPRVDALQRHLSAMIRSDAAMATPLRQVSVADVMERFGSDKKHGSDFYTLILVTQAGDVVRAKLPRTDEISMTVRRAIEEVIERYA